MSGCIGIALSRSGQPNKKQLSGFGYIKMMKSKRLAKLLPSSFPPLWHLTVSARSWSKLVAMNY